jgi:hypothetical protein
MMIRLCRNCEHWRDTADWQGNCKLHAWEKDKYSEYASVPECPDYVDKYDKYKVVAKGGK